MRAKVSLKDLRGLISLMEEGSIRTSSLSEKTWKRLQEEHLVSAKREGRIVTLSASNRELIRGFIQRLCGAENFEEYLATLEKKQVGIAPTRTASAILTNDTKAFGTDVMKGIRLNAIWPVEIEFEGQPFQLNHRAE